MIILKNFMEAVKYEISGGSEFQWSCFGPNAWTLNADSHYATQSASVVFDTQTQTVYEATIMDYVNKRAYRLINPDFAIARKEEASLRGVNDTEAWEGVEFIDLDVDQDWLEKAHAIVNGEEYDERVLISFDIDSDVLFQLMKQAHAEDLTFNDYMIKVLREYCQFL